MNAFNLMDNMDGLSAGIGTIAAFFCGWQALQTGQVLVAIVAGSLAGATLGFLQYNLPPARIFMGDTGSQVLGLGLGTLALMQTWHHGARLLGMLALPTLLLAVPIFDTLFVMVERLIHGRHPFQGGTDHMSHRLGLLGLSSRQVVFTLYALAGAFGFLSILLAGQNPLAITGILLLTLGGLLLLGAYLAKVRVYTGPAPSGAAASTRFTLIDTMLMHKRRILEVLVDFAFVCGCYVMAHLLRYEAYLGWDVEQLLYKSLPWVIVVKMTCFFACGLYRGVWRYIGLSDLLTLIKAVTFGSVMTALALLYLWRFEGYSRAVLVIDWMFSFLLAVRCCLGSVVIC
jgi:UDP-GlcNAc:undecaprenyl-phosphate GlcNAc-1-phosphate transferase